MPKIVNSKFSDWLNFKDSPEERLAKFEAWLRFLLSDTLEFSSNRSLADRQIGQCVAIVKATIWELEQRHFRLDGEHLKGWIESKITDIAQSQRKNLIKDFYPYFKRCWDHYVGERAEELRELTRNDVYQNAIKGITTIPEIELILRKERLKKKLLKRQKQRIKSEAERHQLRLL